MLQVLIDKLTNSIEEVATGRKFGTVVRPATRYDLRSLSHKWQFNWVQAAEQGEVYKLVVPKLGRQIHGLICLTCKADHVFVDLVENHPLNIGHKKRFAGVAGNLVAFAAKLSIDLGHEGYVNFIAKTELIEHYQKTLKAKLIGRGPRMYLDTQAAQRLIDKYLGDET